MKDSFGFWFSGFVDGEGYFGIHKDKNLDNYTCIFVINLRADDAEVLKYIQQNLGIGNIRFQKKQPNPMIRFSAGSKRDCLLLCDVFTKFPLYSKKKRDFEIWKKAVYLWNERTARNQMRDKEVCNQWGPISELFQELRDVRRFDIEYEVVK